MWHLIIALFIASSLSLHSTPKADKSIENIVADGSKGGDKGGGETSYTKSDKGKRIKI